MGTIDASKMDKFVDGKLVKEGKKDASEQGRFYWWKAQEEDMGRQIAATIKFIKTHQSTRIEQLVVATRLYGNSSAFNFIGPGLSKSASASASSQSNRISFNLCAAVIDTLVSKIAKNKVIPTFITSGGVWGMQQKAEKLTKFMEGIFHGAQVHKKAVNLFRDGAVWGTGITHQFNNEGVPDVERVLPHEIEVDEVEAINGDPRQLHRIKVCDRDIVLELFKDSEQNVLDAIKNASPVGYNDLGANGTAADLITVSESWHLRSGKDADDGIHAISVNDTIIQKETWDKDYFPFVFFHYNKRLTGFWGQGICQRLMNLQGEINRLMILIQRSMWMGGSFKVLVENGSKVVSQHINNDVGAIINYTGTPPQYVTPPMIQQDIYPYVDSLIAKGFQQEGVSQLAASSLKPSGVDSGAALRTYDEIGDDRILFTGQEMEECTLEIGRQLIDIAKDIYKEKKTLKVTFPDTKFMESVDWKEVKLDEDEYVMRAYPTSTLPDEPAGRLAYIQEQMQAGLITPRTGKKLMAMPDVEMNDKLANAQENLLCKIIEEMINSPEGEDVYHAPEPYYDLTLAKWLALQYYNYASEQNAPEDKLELLRRFMSAIDDLTGVNSPMQTQGQPMAAPTPTPTSNMIPNVQGVA